MPKFPPPAAKMTEREYAIAKRLGTRIALILSEEPTDPPPQGFDIAVLNQLARFSHPPIAVVVGDRLPNCRLPQFLESDPDLIANILQWLHNLER